MPRFFLESIEESNIQITGEDAHHIGYAPVSYTHLTLPTILLV